MNPGRANRYGRPGLRLPRNIFLLPGSCIFPGVGRELGFGEEIPAVSPVSGCIHRLMIEEGVLMESVLAPAASRLDPAAELIDLSFPEDPFRRMKACSVVTYGESRLQRLPWSGLHRRNERGPSSVTVESSGDPSIPGGRWAVTSRGVPLVGTYERSVFRALEWIAIDASLVQGHLFANPLIVHPRDICERLCWRATQPQFDAI